MEIIDLVSDAHENAKAKGFYDNPVQNVSEKLMLIVSELSEAQDADRKNKYSICGSFSDYLKTPNLKLTPREYFKKGFEKHVKDTFEDEIADAFIRLGDLCGYLNIDIEWHIEMKMKYNELRQKKHGKLY